MKNCGTLSWQIIGTSSGVAMVKEDAFVGSHSPRLNAGAGIRQRDLLEVVLKTDECRQAPSAALIIQASRSSGIFRCQSATSGDFPRIGPGGGLAPTQLHGTNLDWSIFGTSAPPQ